MEHIHIIFSLHATGQQHFSIPHVEFLKQLCSIWNDEVDVVMHMASNFMDKPSAILEAITLAISTFNSLRRDHLLLVCVSGLFILAFE